MPKMGGNTRIEVVGQINRLWQKVSKECPGNLLSSLRQGASMYDLCIGPHSTAKRISEEITRLDVNTLAFSTGSEGENEGNELGERKLAITGEILWPLFVLVVNIFRDQAQKRWDDIVQLA
jgi:hypothetical protein